MLQVPQVFLKSAAIAIHLTIGFAHSAERERTFDFAFEAYRTAPQARLPHRQMPIPGTTPYVPVRDATCPRLDVIAVGKNVTALNVNGHTLGHIRGLMLNRRDGDLSRFDSGQLAFYPKYPPDEEKGGGGVVVSPINCPSNISAVPFSVDSDAKRLVVNDRIVGSFDSFALSAQNHNAATRRRPLVLPWMPKIDINSSSNFNQISASASGSKLGDNGGFTIPGSIGAGSGGTAGLGGSGNKPPKQPRCTPGQGKTCAE